MSMYVKKIVLVAIGIGALALSSAIAGCSADSEASTQSWRTDAQKAQIEQLSEYEPPTKAWCSHNKASIEVNKNDPHGSRLCRFPDGSFVVLW